MNKAAFLDILNHVSAISEQEVAELEKMAVSFPYCQTAHLLLAKAAYDHGSMLSNQKLRRAAACATNRQLLKKLIYTAAANVAITPVAEPDLPATEPIHAPISESDVGEEYIYVPTTVIEQDTAENDEAFIEVYSTDDYNIPAEATIELTDTPLEASGAEIISAETPNELKELAVLPVPSEEEPENRPSPEIQAIEPVAETPDLQDLLFLIEELNPSAPYRDPVTDFISNLNDNEPEINAIEDLVEDDDLVPDENTVLVPAEEFSTEQNQPEDLTSGDSDIEFSADFLPTITQFDEYLFKPEKETEPETVIHPPFKEEIIYKIFSQNDLGYWMASSRLGESLQLKDDLTPVQPYHFQPELILEYSKQHELESYLPPTGNPLNPQQEIINQFLKQNPKLKSMAQVKIKAEPMEDLSSKSTKIKKNLASETLANILTKQGKIKKAIKIYEHLILKIPDKKAYFASQIEKLQKLT